MAIAYNSPNISTGGIISCIDPANRRSYSGSGSLWVDLINNNIGNLINGPTFNSANAGSIAFDGTNDWAEFPINTNYNFDTANFSIFCWMKTNIKSGYQTVIALDNAATGSGIVFYTTPGSGVFRTWIGGNVYNGSIDICNNKWNYIGIVRNSGIVTHYINAISNGSFSATGSVTANQNLRLGSYDGSGYRFTGNISIVTIYNKALSLSEIQQNFNVSRRRFL